MMKKRQQIKLWILYAVLAVLALVFIIIKRDSFTSLIGEITRILRPVIIGAVIAYLCNPIFRMFEQTVFPGIRSFTFRRTLSLIGTYVVLVLIFAILLMLIIPQLLTSILDFLENYEVLLASALDNANGFLDQLNARLNLQIPHIQAEMLKEGLDWIVQNVDVDALMNRLLSGNTILILFEYIEDTFFILTDIIFGLFISIYLLSGNATRDGEALERLKVNLCMECGCCSYVCPAKQDIVQRNKLAKTVLRQYQAAKTQKGER